MHILRQERKETGVRFWKCECGIDRVLLNSLGAHILIFARLLCNFSNLERSKAERHDAVLTFKIPILHLLTFGFK